jgi:ABC-type phosphate transport system substrate-binding protein
MAGMRQRKRAWLVAAALCVLAQATFGAPARSGAAFQVIVNPDNGVASLDATFVRDAYLKRVTTWENGDTVRPVDLTTRYPAREAFARDVLGKTLPQLRSYWNQQIFSGRGVPPPELDSEAAVIRYVLANRGAIGYLPAGVSPQPARAIEVR